MGEVQACSCRLTLPDPQREQLTCLLADVTSTTSTRVRQVARPSRPGDSSLGSYTIGAAKRVADPQLYLSMRLGLFVSHQITQKVPQAWRAATDVSGR